VQGEKICKRFQPRFKQDRKITAVDDIATQFTRACDEAAEVRVQLWRTSGDVNRTNCGTGRKQPEHAFRNFFGHALGSLWAGFHMAMLARLIAHFSYIDLQGSDEIASQWPEAMRT
jgi:hypothetical protein